MNVVNPRLADARIMTTRMSRAMAAGMFSPRPVAFVARAAVVAVVNDGSAASSTAPTSSGGRASASVPWRAHVVTRNVATSGPSAMPTLPPSEKYDGEVAESEEPDQFRVRPDALDNGRERNRGRCRKGRGLRISHDPPMVH